ncbi:MAG: type II toxin-antitoxin system RelE/ParE family toxin [Firmicutes bacterium]|nr:type II toxin-antitoxin system RelE/ParE family toxin [Bacillota bacterium]
MAVKWTKTAMDDLLSIWQYIAKDSYVYADKFTDKLLASTNILEDFPLSGVIVPELANPNIREIIYGSYRVMYLIMDEDIFVTQVTHGARELKLR